MSAVINVVTKIFDRIFVTVAWSNKSLFRIFIDNIILFQPYLLIGTCFLIIGFVVGLIKRLIRS